MLHHPLAMLQHRVVTEKRESFWDSGDRQGALGLSELRRQQDLAVAAGGTDWVEVEHLVRP